MLDIIISAQPQVIGVPTQETGDHIIPIPQPLDHTPVRPSSPKTELSSDETHSEPSSSRSTRSRSKRSLERELKALKMSSPGENNQDLLKNWTNYGYYKSPYPGTYNIFH